MTDTEFFEYELDLLKTHKDLQESIIRAIARSLIKTDFTLTATSKMRAEKLRQSGLLRGEAIALIAAATGKLKSEIKAIFANVEDEVLNYDEKLIASTGKTAAEFKHLSPAAKQIMRSTLKKTSTEAVNLTKTMANVAQTMYIQACDLAYAQVASGAFSYTEAIKNAVKSAAGQGLRVIYPSGHSASLSAAVRRSVLTGISQTAGKITELKAEELGVDLMEISAHAGARPEHAVWQGRIVSRSGREGYLSLSDIGYGEVTGFKGANCKHDWHMFFEGISRPTYTNAELRELNEKTVTYNGKETKAYYALQKQRGMERKVRRLKNELVGLDEAAKNGVDTTADFEAASVKLKRYEAKLKAYCKETGLPLDQSRMQDVAFGRSVSAKAAWANKRALTREQNSGIIKLKSKVSSGEITLNLNKEKQLPHMLETRIEGKSYFDISYDELQEIVRQKYATGQIRISKAGQIKEVITMDRNIGFNVSPTTGESSRTNRFTIHYSKNRTHCVPTAKAVK